MFVDMSFVVSDEELATCELGRLMRPTRQFNDWQNRTAKVRLISQGRDRAMPVTRRADYTQLFPALRDQVMVKVHRTELKAQLMPKPRRSRSRWMWN